MPVLRREPQIHIVVALNKFLKVDRTTSHHFAITADGELLTWGCESEIMEQADKAATAYSVWQQGVRHSPNDPMDDWYCACTGYSASLGIRTRSDCDVDASCQGNARRVLRIVANKQAVADVACGQGHTIALLVSGEVRVSFVRGKSYHLSEEIGTVPHLCTLVQYFYRLVQFCRGTLRSPRR